ncbi:class I SAM-dependent methyltransferase [Actinophytocola sp.]|uniref:class I SAM-dependent methyltransferase n=1 Tax=Actinophytocola sp. TaxID=1872138 RepID=UPI002D80A4EE|nr:class I SAM-dependent methyltransferase [Actinophytocola sp.]HET9140173.1 class I SAM-dependent methyltransferase [Actinophytocola sp.]
MTERTSHSPAEREYLPAMGKHYLLPFYDVVHHLFGLAPIHREMIELAGPRAGHRVLDVGCGTGNLLRSISRAHPGVELTGLDPDPKVLAKARRKLTRRGRTARLDRGFAEELPYPDGSFDRVFSSLMLHHLDTSAKDELLAEVRRVLRPDGVLVLADLVVDGEHDHHHRHGPGRRPGPMRERLKDNVGDTVAERIAAAGFDVEPTRIRTLRRGHRIGIISARPQSHS